MSKTCRVGNDNFLRALVIFKIIFTSNTLCQSSFRSKIEFTCLCHFWKMKTLTATVVLSTSPDTVSKFTYFQVENPWPKTLSYWEAQSLSKSLDKVVIFTCKVTSPKIITKHFLKIFKLQGNIFYYPPQMKKMSKKTPFKKKTILAKNQN